MLRFVFFIVVVIFDTVFHAIFAMAAGLINPYSSFNSGVLRNWGKVILWANGSRMEISGLEHIRQGDSYIVVANHQSHMDIPVAVSALPLPLRIVSKKELFKIPFMGWGMSAIGILKIDRSNRVQAIETLKQAEETIRKFKLSILAFPEGTRSEDGKIHSFKKGPIILAINTRFPILPVSISGTRNLLPKGRIVPKRGNIKVVIHQPIPTADLTLSDRNDLIARVRERVEAGFIENYS